MPRRIRLAVLNKGTVDDPIAVKEHRAVSIPKRGSHSYAGRRSNRIIMVSTQITSSLRSRSKVARWRDRPPACDKPQQTHQLLSENREPLGSRARGEVGSPSTNTAQKPDKKGRESIGRPGRERERLDDPLMLRPRTIATPRRTASAPRVRSWQQSSGDDHAIACASRACDCLLRHRADRLRVGRPDHDVADRHAGAGGVG